ncbi:hypothetical protein AMR72_05585 [Flavobacterium psychrophilum]|nr:hypothetical protein AMR72_05585 [Flavobacterium psychrophilum]AOE52034.1 hypothetical protein ALW18_05580 [Flavobacterium psychrophilum]
MKKHQFLIIAVLFSFAAISCDGFFINKKTSEIIHLSSCCNSDSTWTKIYNTHRIENSENAEIREIIAEFKRQPFSNTVLYFKDYPEEYIGIGDGGSSIRYVYNKKISSQVLNGLSPELSESEKLRIALRVNSILFNYVGEESRKESAIILKYQCEDLIENYKE